VNTAQFANFFRELGHRLVITNKCLWFNPHPFLFKSLPFHQIVDPSPDEVARVFLHGPALAVRYPSPAHGATADGGMYVCSRRDYDIESLSANVRSHTRRGLARCNIRQIDFAYLRDHGYGLFEDTIQRQTNGRPSISTNQWRHFCTIASQTVDTEAWGAFVEGRFAAYIVGMLIDDCYYIHVQKSASDLLKYYPNNALTFVVLKEKLSGGLVSAVSHGQIALAAREGLYRFKRSMGFEIQPFKERVIFNPLIKSTLRFGRGMASILQRRDPANLFWRRVSRSIELARDAPLGRLAVVDGRYNPLDRDLPLTPPGERRI